MKDKQYRVLSHRKSYVVQIKVGKRWKKCNTNGEKASLIDRFIGDVAKTDCFHRANRYKRFFESLIN